MSAELILEVAQHLALTQADNPNAKDDAGFSNADYPAAFTLVALGDIVGCAALLRLYARQAGAMGITPEILQPYLGETEGMANAEARQALAASRRGAEGTLAWTKLQSGDVLFNGLGLSGALRRQLAAAGKRIPQGWVVPASRLEQATRDVDPDNIARLEDFKALVAETPQEAPAPTGRPAPPPMRISYDQGFGQLQWTNPFSDTGVEVRQLVKRLGAQFDGATKSWAMRDPVALQALLTLAEDLDVPVHGIEPVDSLQDASLALVDEIRSGVVKVIVVDVQGDMLWYRTRSKVEGAWDAAKARGGWYDRERMAIRVAMEDLRELMFALDKVPNLDSSPLLPYLSAYELAQEKAQAPDILEQVPFVTPTGLELFPHQREGIAFLATLGWDGKAKGGILADDMGLGKTLQACVAANLRHPEPESRFLIVCPASLKHNWAREIRQWVGQDETVQIVDGRSDTIGDARWVVINYDVLSRYVDPIRAIGFKLMICDEAHVLRTPDIQRSVAAFGARKVKDREENPGIIPTVDQCWLLTGTAILNRTRELWNLLRGIGHPLGQDWWKFATRYCGARQGAVGMDFNGSSNMSELTHKIGSVYLKRWKNLVLNLPDKLRTPYIVDMSREELAAYHEAVDAMLGRLDGEESETCILAELNALKLQTAMAKLPATIDLAEQIVDEGRKVVVFSYYRDALDALEEKFGSAAVRIDGGVSAAKRQVIVDRFQNDPGIKVFIGQIEAAGVGITLTASQDVIINDFPWTPAILLQAEDRTWRIGQGGTVTVRHMQAHGTFDADLLSILQAKQEVIDSFESGADAASKARMSVIKKVLASIKRDAKTRAAVA